MGDHVTLEQLMIYLKGSVTKSTVRGWVHIGVIRRYDDGYSLAEVDWWILQRSDTAVYTRAGLWKEERPSDSRAQQAREHHRQSVAAGELAARHREQRDSLVRQLRTADPGRWTYTALAKAVGCSPELIATIIRNG